MRRQEADPGNWARKGQGRTCQTIVFTLFRVKCNEIAYWTLYCSHPSNHHLAHRCRSCTTTASSGHLRDQPIDLFSIHHASAQHRVHQSCQRLNVSKRWDEHEAFALPASGLLMVQPIDSWIFRSGQAGFSKL